MKFSNLSLALVSLLVVAATVDAHEQETLTWSILDTKLPEPISDMTATLGGDDMVYIAGGCNDPSGNTFDAETGWFSCLKTTDAFYSFDPSTNKFNTLPSLPRARYRHGAAFSNNRLWLLGGRTLMDNVIPEVDVFDFGTNTWLTPGNLTLGISDTAAFAIDNYVYIAGGWNQDYNALTNAWRIKSDSVDSIQQEDIAPLNVARGDVKAAIDKNGLAHVAGGFTDQNDYCPALDSVERYDASTNTWTNATFLSFARGDKALAVLSNGHLVALGGETAIDATCTIKNPDHGGATATIDEVEILSDDGLVWEEAASIPDAKFRFDAVSVGNKLYAFGGQNAYNDDCKCYSSSDEIIVFTEEESSGGVIASGAAIVVAAAAAALFMM